MKTAYIFHDAFCDPMTDWYPWMKTTLEQQGYFVVVPKFPTPAGQSYDSWKAVMKNYMSSLDTETIFVGHGVGGAFALRILEELPSKIHGLFLVASYAEPLGHVGYDRVNETFVNRPFDWVKIKNNVLTIKVFAGQNDPFVPVTLTENLAVSLGVSVISIPEGGHINKASGFTQCIPLAQGIKEGLGEIDKSMVVEHPLPADAEVIEAANFVRPADAAFQSETNMSEESAPLGEKKFAAEAPTRVHTMYQDMTTLVNSNKGTVAASLLGKARADEAEQKIQQPSSPLNTVYILGTIIALIMTLAISIFLVSKFLPAQKSSPLPTISSLLRSESHQNIAISGKQSYEVSQAIRTALVQKPVVGSVADIYYTKANLRASFMDVLASLDLADDIPIALTNEFIPAQTATDPVFMHLAASLNGTPAHALILPITQYDRAFSGFREWEPTLMRDIGLFMNIPDSVLKSKITKDTFRDEMISNKGIRVLRTDTQEFLLGYFFLNDRTVIVIDTPNIVPEILTRYANSQIYK